MMERKEHATVEGLPTIRELKDKMSPKGVNCIIQPQPNKLLNPEQIRGFVDAEGCFYVSVTKNSTSKLGYRVVCSFSVSQDTIELSVLESLWNFFNCGSIPPQSNKDKIITYEYRVTGLTDLQTKIILFFDNYPLQTCKQNAFEKFKKVVRILQNPLTLEDLDKIIIIAQSINPKLSNYQCIL